MSGTLERISQPPQEDDEACELDEAEEILGLALPARDDAPEPHEPGEEALDLSAAAVAAQLAAVLSLAALRSIRGDELGAELAVELRVERVTPIGVQSAGPERLTRP